MQGPQIRSSHPRFVDLLLLALTVMYFLWLYLICFSDILSSGFQFYYLHLQLDLNLAEFLLLDFGLLTSDFVYNFLICVLIDLGQKM